MGSDELASIIIPTYYRNDQLSQAIRSAQNQTYEPIEIIVVDDSGERHAESACEQFDVEYVAHDDNKGAHAARDTGFDACEGSYIQFLDDDDELHSDKIARQVSLLESESQAGVAHCGFETATGDITLPPSSTRGDVLAEALAFHGVWRTSFLLIERSVLERISPLYRDSPGADDIRMIIRLATETEFEYVNAALVTTGPGERGASWGALEGRRQILDEFSELYDCVDPQIRRRALEEVNWFEGRCHLASDKWTLAAPLAFAKAAYYADSESRPFRLVETLASLAGRRGVTAASTIRSRLGLRPPVDR